MKNVGLRALMPSVVAATTLSVLSLAGAPAHAQGTPADIALAESLFRQAKDAVGDLRFDEACPKFQESHRLDPKLGTLLNLALCHEQQGKVATAWGEFTDAAREAKRVGRSDREAFALEHVRALEPRLSFLRVTSVETVATSWLLDGRSFSSASFGSRLPIDPGGHVLEVSAPGRQTWSKKFDVGKTPSVVELEIPALSAADSKRPIASAPAPVVETPAPATRSLGPLVGVGSIAILGLGVGTAFGLTAMSKHNQGDELCTGSVCRGEGAALQDEARTAAWISTAAFGVGAVASGVFVFLALQKPKPDAAPPSAAMSIVPVSRAGGGGVQLRGVF